MRCQGERDLPPSSAGDNVEPDTLESVRRSLGEAEAERMILEGRAMSLEKVIEYALGRDDESA